MLSILQDDVSYSRPSFDEVIRKIGLLHLELKNRSNTSTHGSTTPPSTLSPTNLQLNMFDVMYIQAYLNSSSSHNSSLSYSWRNQFTWLSDILTSLNTFHLRRAQIMSPQTYSRFLFQALIPVFSTTTTNSLPKVTSTHLSHVEIYGESSCCHLKRDIFTQKFEFLCTSRPCLFSGLPKFTQIQVIGLKSQSNNIKLWPHNSSLLDLMIFENDNLLPIQMNTSKRSNYDLLKLTKSPLLSLDPKLTSTCSQILAIRHTSTPIQLDGTIEIQLPLSFRRILRMMHLQLTTSSTMNNSIMNDRDLFEYIFDNSPGHDQIDETSDDQTIMVISNGNLEMVASANDQTDPYRPTDSDKRFVRNEVKMSRFKSQLINQWLNPNAYELVYSELKDFSEDNQTRYQVIEWKLNRTDINCQLTEVDINWHPNVSIAFVDLFRAYITLSCVSNVSSTNLTFIAVRHKSVKVTAGKVTTYGIQFLFDFYSSAFKLNLDSIDLTLIESIGNSLKLKYRFFKYRLVYVSSALAAVFLFSNILLYWCFHSRLQMPRSFYHVLVNKWIAILNLIFIYASGSSQIHLPFVCFVSAVLTHYLVLASFSWYALYFYVIFKKLQLLQKRNVNLILNDSKSSSKDMNECNSLDDKKTGKIFFKNSRVMSFILYE